MVTVINCPQCNTEIACNLPACPHCGRDGKEFQGLGLLKRLNLPKATERTTCGVQWTILRKFTELEIAELERRAAEIIDHIYGCSSLTFDDGKAHPISEVYAKLEEGGLSQIERGQRDEMADLWRRVLTDATGEPLVEELDRPFLVRRATHSDVLHRFGTPMAEELRPDGCISLDYDIKQAGGDGACGLIVEGRHNDGFRIIIKDDKVKEWEALFGKASWPRP